MVGLLSSTPSTTALPNAELFPFQEGSSYL